MSTPGVDVRFRGLLDAVLLVASDLALPAVLRHITEAACTLVDARYGALGVIGPDRSLEQFIHVGITSEDALGIGPLPKGQGLLGLLIVDPKPVRIADIAVHPDSYGIPPHHPPMHSFLGVPISVREQVFGNLYLTEKIGSDAFTEEDEELVIALSAVAGVIIENVRLQGQVQALAVLEDRERIARDLHDTVIQRLFASGMALQGAARLAEPMVAERIQDTIDDLDVTIRDIRSAIFALQPQASPAGDRGLRAMVMGVIAEAAGPLSFEPHLHLAGPIDAQVPVEVGEQLLAVVREALSNAARHAQANRVDVFIEAGTSLVLRVVDDGVGFSGSGRAGGNGLGNMTRRAKTLGGTFELRAGESSGTVLEWTVPLTDRPT
ncbi:MAG: GAF domain-containing sensor histidine kinase [Acidimicrobiales bacterium]